MTKSTPQNIQERYLNALRKAQTYVSIITTNGFQFKKARIVSFDSFVILIESSGGQVLLFKHAISSIIPESAVDLAILHGE